ncbi:MAG: LTA synthase family protein [Elusimicrobiota bacterium]|nr:LTA synthase family protein [Elusimicrobiota bacterium]
MSLEGLEHYIVQSFILGLRFDLSSIAYINAPIILIFTTFLIIRNLLLFKNSVFFIKFYYWISFTFLAILNAIDFAFYSIFNNHINILIFDFFKDDALTLIKTIIYDPRFLTATMALIVSSCAIYILVSRTCNNLISIRYFSFNTSFLNIFNMQMKITTVLIIFVLTFLMARGTVSMFPLGKYHTQISPNTFINDLSITSLSSLADALYAKYEQSDKKKNVQELLKVSKNEIDASIFEKISQENKTAEEIKPNVVVIIMEGFGKLPILYNSPGFNVLGELKEHFEQDTVFYNFLAAGTITINALETTILNMPQRPAGIQITQSPQSFKKFPSSSAKPYKDAGYSIKAVYGGSLTWRTIEDFLKNQGFQTYGEGTVVKQFPHQWGINDKQFFELVLRELKKKSAMPQFIWALSTATHAPYETPPYYKALNLEIPDDLMKKITNNDRKYIKQMFKTYQFANREAAKFLTEIKNSDLAQNTIVVITGDHNLREFTLKDEELFKRYAVPLYVYVPEKLKKKFNTELCASHLDIMPTLYDLSLSKAKYISAGISLLEEENVKGINFNNDHTNSFAKQNSNKSKKHIAFNSEGFVLCENIAAQYDIATGKTKNFTFDSNTKMLSFTQETKEHKDLVDYYKKTVASADVYLNRDAYTKTE